MQKEMLSAFMDGESVDSETLQSLNSNSELQNSWQSYHLIRDVMHGDVDKVIHLDIAERVAQALENEPTYFLPGNIPESQPEPQTWLKTPYLQWLRPWVSHITQIGVAACVSLTVIVGFQHYNQSGNPDEIAHNDILTVPVSGQFLNNQVSPVSYGVPTEVSDQQLQQLQEQRRRINALLNDYELQRRVYNGQLSTEQMNSAAPNHYQQQSIQQSQ